MINEIEDAILERIKAAHDGGHLPYKLKTIETWGGDIGDDLRKIVKSFPAIWVIFAGERKGKRSRNTQEYHARYNVVVAAQSLRNEKRARKGDVGSYQMIKDVKALLDNQKLGLEIAPLTADSATALVNENSSKHMASIYGIEFSTSYWADLIDDAGALDDFSTFHSNWDIPPHGNVGNETIPDDENADATDHITLGD